MLVEKLLFLRLLFMVSISFSILLIVLYPLLKGYSKAFSIFSLTAGSILLVFNLYYCLFNSVTREWILGF